MPRAQSHLHAAANLVDALDRTPLGDVPRTLDGIAREIAAAGTSLVALRSDLEGFRDLVVAAEMLGWDCTENQAVLDKGREAYRNLCLQFPDAAPADFEVGAQ